MLHRRDLNELGGSRPYRHTKTLSRKGYVKPSYKDGVSNPKFPMNILLPRVLRTLYRKEPISSFILVVGAVDAVMGGVSQRWSLFSFGLFIVSLSMILRWWQVQKAQPIITKDKPRRYLPPSSSNVPLPLLTHEKSRR